MSFQNFNFATFFKFKEIFVICFMDTDTVFIKVSEL